MLDPVEVSVVELPSVQPRPLRGGLAAAVLPGQEPARERKVGDEADAEALAGRQQLLFGFELQPGVFALLAGERRQAALCRDRVRLLDHLRGEVRRADSAHRSFLDELVERAERLLERRDAVGAVVLVEVDPVGLQPAQRGLDRLPDVGAGAASGLAVAQVISELRREDDLVTPSGERAADDLLAAAPVAVDVRGVEEGDVRVERGVDHRARGLLVDAAAEVVAAEPDDGHLEVGAPQTARAHRRRLVKRTGAPRQLRGAPCR